MGKKNFGAIYSKIKADNHGRVFCYIHKDSDEFDPNNNYAGVIIYSIDGHRGLMVIIKNSTGVRPGRLDGQVHYFPVEKVLAIPQDSQNDRILRGGFAYEGGQFKDHSVFCNAREQTDEGDHDGRRELSPKERILAKYCWDEYVKSGPGAVFEIPRHIENQIMA